MFSTPSGIKGIALGGTNGFLFETLRNTPADAVMFRRAVIATAQQAHRERWTLPRLVQVLFVKCLGIHDRTPLAEFAARISGLRLRNF